MDGKGENNAVCVLFVSRPTAIIIPPQQSVKKKNNKNINLQNRFTLNVFLLHK